MPIAHLVAATLPWRWFGAVVIAYAIVALQHIELPGVYMDTVNPDYLVVQILNRNHADVVHWALRGNLIFGARAPVLIQLYHGSQQFWLGLPFFWLFGTTVAGLRLTHAMFALAILAALYWLLLRGRLAPWQAALACIALAIDPAFSYAFRTQSYITLAPCAWLLLALTLLTPAAQSTPGRRAWFWSGVFVGAAVAGYFIYAFFLPVLVAVALKHRRAMPLDERIAVRPIRRWVAGLLVGGCPYIIGLFLALWSPGEPSGLIAFIQDEQSRLAIFSSPMGLLERIAFAWKMTHGIVENAWHHSMMFGEWAPVPASTVKCALLIASPYALWVVAEYRRTADNLLRALVALPLAFFILSLIFGGRLGGHHFVSVVPLLYAGLAIGVVRGTAQTRKATATITSPVLSAAMVCLLTLNAVGQLSVMRTLVATRGVGLMSDAINRFADELNRANPKPWVFTPDWGIALPVVFLTHGDVPVSSENDHRKALRALCAGGDVAVVLLDGDRGARIHEWQERLGWRSPSAMHYRQADGRVVFDVFTFRGDPLADACASATNGRRASD